jgi:hypothetical protein
MHELGRRKELRKQRPVMEKATSWPFRARNRIERNLEEYRIT